MTREDYAAMDAALESVFDTAMEAASHTISKETRDSLPDDCFGIIEEDDKGNKKRIYPLRVPKDKKATEELVAKAIQFFHYCTPARQKQLAEAIMDTIRKEKIKVSIATSSQILKHVSSSKIPATVNLVEPKKRASKNDN